MTLFIACLLLGFGSDPPKPPRINNLQILWNLIKPSPNEKIVGELKTTRFGPDIGEDPPRSYKKDLKILYDALVYGR